MSKECFIDIETTGTNFANMNNRIIAYAILCGNDLDVKIASSKSEEKELIESLLKSIRKCDVIIGYNILKFDIPYILVRAFANAVDASIIFEKRYVDVLLMARERIALPSYTLDYIAWSLGFAKFEYPVKKVRIPQLWNIEAINGKDFELIRKRLEYDVRATKYVYEVLGK